MTLNSDANRVDRRKSGLVDMVNVKIISQNLNTEKSHCSNHRNTWGTGFISAVLWIIWHYLHECLFILPLSPILTLQNLVLQMALLDLERNDTSPQCALYVLDTKSSLCAPNLLSLLVAASIGAETRTLLNDSSQQIQKNTKMCIFCSYSRHDAGLHNLEIFVK